MGSETIKLQACRTDERSVIRRRVLQFYVRFPFGGMHFTLPPYAGLNDSLVRFRKVIKPQVSTEIISFFMKHASKS